MDSQSRCQVKPGDITWIKIHDSWWPAQVVDEESVGDKPQKNVKDESLVRLYGTYDYFYLDPLKSFAEFESMLKRESRSMRQVFQKSLKQDQSLLKSGCTATRKVFESKDSGAAESSKGKRQMQDSIERKQEAISSASPEATLGKSEVQCKLKEKDGMQNKSLGQKNVKLVITRKPMESKMTQCKFSEAKSIEQGTSEEQVTLEMAINGSSSTKDTKLDGVRRSSRINAISEDKSMKEGIHGEQITSETTRNGTSVTKGTKQDGVRRSSRINAVSEDRSMEEGIPGEQITSEMTRNGTSVTKGTKQDGVRRSSRINAVSEDKSMKEGIPGEQITSETTRNGTSVTKGTKQDGVRRSSRINVVSEDKSMKEGIPGEQITSEMTRNGTSVTKGTKQDGVRRSSRINAVSEDKSTKEGMPAEQQSSCINAKEQMTDKVKRVEGISGEQITTKMTRNGTSVTKGTKQDGARRSSCINTTSEGKCMKEGGMPGEQVTSKMPRNGNSVTKDPKQDGVGRSSCINTISQDKCMRGGMPGEQITSKMARIGTSVTKDTKQDSIRRSSRNSALSEEKCVKEGMPGEQITTEMARNGISVTNNAKWDGVGQLSHIIAKEQMTDKIKNDAFPLRNEKAKQDKVAKGNVAKKARNGIARTVYQQQDDLMLVKSKAIDAEIRAMVRDVLFKGRTFEQSEAGRSDSDTKETRNVTSDENTKNSFWKQQKNVEKQVDEEISISLGVKTRSGASETEKSKQDGCRKRKHTDASEQVNDIVQVAENFGTRASRDTRKKLEEVVNTKKVKMQNGFNLKEKSDVKKHLISETPIPIGCRVQENAGDHSARQIRVMQSLGLIAPSESPFCRNKLVTDAHQKSN